MYKWRVGDLVIWDNCCMLYWVMGYDVFCYKRDLCWTTINEFGLEVSSMEVFGVVVFG